MLHACVRVLQLAGVKVWVRTRVLLCSIDVACVCVTPSVGGTVALRLSKSGCKCSSFNSQQALVYRLVSTASKGDEREREIIAVIWDIWTASSILKDESYMKLTSICLRSYFGKIIWRTSRCVFRGFPKHIQIYQYISINYLDCHGLPCSIMGDMVNITPTKLRHVSIVLVSMLTWASPVKHSCVWTQPRWAAGVAADSRAVGIKMYSINPCRYIKGILWY